MSLGRVIVEITEQANRPPVASPETRTIFGPGVPTSFDVLANAIDPDNTPGGMSVVPGSVARVSGDGTVALAGQVVTITPNPNYIGSIVATFTIADGQGLTSSAQVTLNILEQPNRAPVARDDNADVSNGASVTVPVLFNDSDPDGDPLSVALTSTPDPSLGTARLTSERSIVFTAAPGASGLATIDYEISDGELTSSARLQITVRGVRRFAAGGLGRVHPDGLPATGRDQSRGVRLERIVRRRGRPRRLRCDERCLHPAGGPERQRHRHVQRRQRLRSACVGRDHHRRQSGTRRVRAVVRHRPG